jgi:hypothetical protein
VATATIRRVRMPRIAEHQKLDNEITRLNEQEERLRTLQSDLRQKLAEARKRKRLVESSAKRKEENHIKFTIGGELFALGMTMEQAAKLRRLAEPKGGAQWILDTLETVDRRASATSPSPGSRASNRDTASGSPS